MKHIYSSKTRGNLNKRETEHITKIPNLKHVTKVLLVIVSAIAST